MDIYVVMVYDNIDRARLVGVFEDFDDADAVRRDIENNDSEASYVIVHTVVMARKARA